MRVLTIGNMYPPHHQGGYEIVWHEAVTYLRSRGHEVRVLTTTYQLPGAARDTEQDVYRELRWYWQDGEWPRIPVVERIRLERANARRLERHLADVRPDVVCFWAMGGMSLSLIERVRRKGIALAFVVCDDWLLYAPQVDAWLRAVRRLPVPPRVVESLTGLPARIDIARAGPWLFPSQTVRRRAISAGWGLGESVVCHQGVDERMFRPAETGEWRWRCLYVGRVDLRKGVEVAVEALAHLPAEATLRIVGRGDPPDVAAVESLVASEGLDRRVTLQSVPREELRDVYAAADVLVFPVIWEEPWGLVPLEAMAVGIPVVATGRGGSGEYLEDEENCLLFDADAGPAALAAAVCRLAGDGELREHLRAGGLETTRRFGPADFSRAVERLLDEATS